MELVDAFEWYADWAAREADSPLYARLARAAARSPDVRALARDRPPGQPAPQLLLGAVHDRLLVGASHRLGEWYPTCVDDPRDPETNDPAPAFREFCSTRAAGLRDITSTRRVSTNAVGRSAILYPAFGRVVARDEGPLAILELGASAGLNLRWDRYHYAFGERSCGRSESAVTIRSRVRTGDPPLPPRPPAVTDRRGVDLHPPDPTDPDDARWLRALVVPDHADRHDRLSAAIAAARDDPPQVEAGDAVDLLPGLLDRMPEGTPCVYSTHVRYQMDDAETGALDEQLRAWSRERRRVHSLHTDNEADCPGNGYRHVVFEEGERTTDELIGAYESYGRWIEWYGPGRSPNRRNG